MMRNQQTQMSRVIGFVRHTQRNMEHLLLLQNLFFAGISELKDNAEQIQFIKSEILALKGNCDFLTEECGAVTNDWNHWRDMKMLTVPQNGETIANALVQLNTIQEEIAELGMLMLVQCQLLQQPGDASEAKRIRNECVESGLAHAKMLQQNLVQLSASLAKLNTELQQR